MPALPHPADYYELQYNLGLTVKEMPIVTGGWPARAEVTRARYPMSADIAYGSHPRETMDVFRAAEPKGTMIYIHGGFWRARSKIETSWVADGYPEEGYSVALLSYPLCPEVTLADISDCTRRAFAKLYRDVLSVQERQRIVVVGHSAGGYLAAMLMTADWYAYGLPAKPFHGAMAISGIFDLAPLLPTTINDALHLTPEQAQRLSLLDKPFYVSARLVLAAGGLETDEFRRQTQVMAQKWSALSPEVIEVPGKNHFDVLDGLVEPGHAMRAAVFEMLAAAS